MATTTRKRSRNSGSSSSNSGMPRTTSLSELGPLTRVARGGSAVPSPMETGAGAGLSTVQRRHSMSSFPVAEAAFLKVCGYCRRGLGPGRDTFIYMGEVAFCSHECRQQQMNIDEFMETKCFPPAGAAAQTVKAAP
ncbi:hypothetical protein QOZ80_6AG0514400 [Eleusine coracana subsp. coracana]|nr:hypothetical protein QOZ80_6AG0514400 [Eleusine coracana subsp. coracana]